MRMRDSIDPVTVARPRILQIGLARFAEAPGGLPRSFDDTVSMLVGDGYDVKALVCGQKATEQETGGRYVAFAPMDATTAERVMRARRVIARTITDFAPAVVGSHFALYSAACPHALRRQPHVVHFHGPWSREAAREGAGNFSAGIKHLVERYVYRGADRHIVLSSAFAEVLQRFYGVSPDTIRIIPGSVDTARFKISESRSQARERLGWPRDRPIVLAVRRFVHRVGLHNLITAAIELRRLRPDVLVIIAGVGPLKSQLVAQIEENDLSKHVKLVGRLSDEDLPVAYRAADMTVVPSEALEGFGLPTIESLACGTPVIVTPVGGLPEVVEQLHPQLITENASAGAICRAILAAINGELYLPDSEQCSRYVLERFAPDVVGAQMSAAYRELM